MDTMGHSTSDLAFKSLRKRRAVIFAYRQDKPVASCTPDTTTLQHALQNRYCIPCLKTQMPPQTHAIRPRRPLRWKAVESARTRDVVSHGEQCKSIECIRRSEKHRQARRESSIRGTDRSAEHVKTARDRNAEVVRVKRTRRSGEKKALNEPLDTWESLSSSAHKGEQPRETFGQTSGSRASLSIVPSPTDNTQTSEHAAEDSSSSTAVTLSSKTTGSSCPCPHRHGRQGQQHRSKQHRSPDSVAVGSMGADVSHSSSLVRQRPFTTPLHEARAPPPLLWEAIRDAETGEWLELRQPTWTYDLTTTSAETVAMAARGCDCGRGDGDGDRYRRSLERTLGEVHEGTLLQPRMASPPARLGGGDEDRAHYEEFRAELADTSRSNDGMVDLDLKRSKPGTELSRNSDESDDNNVDSHEQRSGEQRWARSDLLKTDSLPTTEFAPTTIRSAAPMTTTKHAPSRCASGNEQAAFIGNDAFCDVGLSHSSFFVSDSEEPQTPRPRERLHSPCWIPPPQEPRGQARMERSTGRRSEGTRGQSHTSDGPRPAARPNQLRLRPSTTDQEHRRQVFTKSPGGRVASAPTVAVPKWSVQTFGEPDIPDSVKNKNDDTADFCGDAMWSSEVNDTNRRSPAALTSDLSYTTISESVPDEVWNKMVDAQEIRDRYLRQLRQMVADEKAEETRRNATLRSAPVHSLRRQRLDLGFARDRKKKRDLIEWIRRDNELILVQKMAGLGLIR